MELRHLRYFIAVAEEENITRAAARLHVSQPSLSRQIRDLEYELGVDLFDHSARAIRLTEAGRHFLPEAMAVVGRMEQAVRSVRNFADEEGGEFHLAYAPSLTTEILPRTLREFQTKCPSLKVTLHDLSNEEMLSGLRERTLDAALAVKSSNPAMEGLVFREISRYHPFVAMPLSHPLAAKKKVSVEDLSEQSLVSYSQSGYPEYHVWLGKLFKGLRPPRILSEHDSSTSLIAMVESGKGIAVVHQGLEKMAGPNLLVRPLLNAEKNVISFGVACRKGDTTRATRAFIEAALSSAS